MRNYVSSTFFVAAFVSSMSVSAAPTLFNTELKSATREDLRTVLQSTSVIVVREDDGYWVDQYNPNGLLTGASELNFGYSSNGVFAYAEYKFPAFVDKGKIIEVANLVSSKYGQPSQRTGNTNLGDASLTWNFKNGMAIVVYRGWPDTTTYLQIKDKTNYEKMNAEIKSEQQRQYQQKSRQQHAAF